MDKVLTKIIADVANNHSLDIQEVERVFTMPYKMMRDTIQKLELKGKLYDEVDGYKTNFNMPILFKLYLNKYKLNKLNTKEDDEEEIT